MASVELVFLFLLITNYAAVQLLNTSITISCTRWKTISEIEIGFFCNNPVFPRLDLTGIDLWKHWYFKFEAVFVSLYSAWKPLFLFYSAQQLPWIDFIKNALLLELYILPTRAKILLEVHTWTWCRAAFFRQIEFADFVKYYLQQKNLCLQSLNQTTS